MLEKKSINYCMHYRRLSHPVPIHHPYHRSLRHLVLCHLHHLVLCHRHHQ